MKSDENVSRPASNVVVEDFMEGEEPLVFGISDGHTSHILHNAQDHKRIGDHDTGPNTGGMGAYSPAPLVTDELIEEIRQSIVDPTITGMQVEESAYTGILDRKSTRLNSSHVAISYAVFCFKKKSNID